MWKSKSVRNQSYDIDCYCYFKHKKESENVDWSNLCTDSFRISKSTTISAQALWNATPEIPWTVPTDVSEVRIEYVHTGTDVERIKYVGYTWMKLNQAEQNYHPLQHDLSVTMYTWPAREKSLLLWIEAH